MNALCLLTKTDSNDVDHARIRKLTAHAFSEVALREQLPLIASHLHKFVHQIKQRASETEGGKVDLNEWFNYLSFDVVTDLSFGESLGALKRGTPDPYIEGFWRSCKMWIMIPLMWEYTIIDLLFKAMLRIPAVKRDREMSYLGTKSKVDKRMATQTDRKDFMAYVSTRVCQPYHMVN